MKLLAYPITILYYLCFGITLVIFHAIQWISFNLFGYSAHKKSVDILQFFLLRCLNVLGCRITVNNTHNLPTNVPLIIVANHQSMYDISPILWHFRKHHVKFISKKELGKGIPSISYNLRHGGSVLIDRKDRKQSLLAIKNFAEYIKKNNYAAVIFPEGTRSKTGQPKAFQKGGLLTLFKYVDNALLVPVTINDSWKTHKYGDSFPLGLGAHLKFDVHKPLKIADFENKEALIDTVETTIKKAILA